MNCISLTIWISLIRMPILVGVTGPHVRAFYGVNKSFLINPCLSQSQTVRNLLYMFVQGKVHFFAFPSIVWMVGEP